MNTVEVTCPSGLRGVLREMKVKEEQLFTNRKLARAGKTLTALLDSCWLETQEAGPYTMTDGKPDWSNALSSDRTHLLIQLRIASVGDSYDFRTTCAGCRQHFNWTVKLNELDVKPVSPEGIQHVKTGEPLVISLPGGNQVKCRLLRGADEEFLSTSIKDESKTLSYHLARRIVEWNGKTHWREVLMAVEDMSSREADSLWDALDDIEGGVDTMFDIECPHCYRLQQMILPFEAGFFSNRKRFSLSPVSEDG